MVQKIQPMVLWGWREATMAPTIEKGSHVAKVKTVSIAPPYGSSGLVDPIVLASAIPPTMSAMDSATSDHASQEAARVLIPRNPRPRSLAPSVTTLLYSTTVSQTLRKALRGRRFRVNFGDGVFPYELR